MLTVSNLTVGRGFRDLFTDVSFSVGAGERIAILGPNGSGKSTLVECIAGRLVPRSGSVSRNPPDLAVGYLEQSHDVTGFAATVGEFLEADMALEEQLTATAARLAASPGDPRAEADYAAALERLTAAPSAAGAPALADWSLEDLDPAMPVHELSGGQRQKLALARLIADRPDFLLLDEPTNHLDTPALDRLADVLIRFSGGVLLVSHDRAFLDSVTTGILAIDPASGTLTRYAGNYTAHAQQRTRERERQSALFRSEQAEIARMRRDIVRTREQARRVETSTTPRNPNVRRLAKKVARKASSREKKLERYRNDPDRAQRPTDGWRLKVEFGDAAGGSRALALERLAIGYAGRPPLLEEVTVDLGTRERVALQGPERQRQDHLAADACRRAASCRGAGPHIGGRRDRLHGPGTGDARSLLDLARDDSRRVRDVGDRRPLLPALLPLLGRRSVAADRRVELRRAGTTIAGAPGRPWRDRTAAR